MSMLARFPTEKLVLHKPSGVTYEVVGLVGASEIGSEDISIPIEQNDYFERNLPNGIVEYYKVINPGFHKGMHGIPDHYQTKVQQITTPVIYETDCVYPHMIFISHSSKDKKYTKAFVDLLFSIGLNEEDIVCSSYPGLGVPFQASIYEWLVEKFQKCDLHVFYFLSHNYYKSAASLNEMGAAWAMKQKWDYILLPEFSFSEIAGCIDSSKIGIKLDGDLDELKHRLGELKDDIVMEFGLRQISGTRWEKIRDEFITKVGRIISEEGSRENPALEDNQRLSVVDEIISDNSELNAFILLFYAANSDEGEIVVFKRGDNMRASYIAGKYSFNKDDSPREIAKWDEAVNHLLVKNAVTLENQKDGIIHYHVTNTGYNLADEFARINNLDDSKTPKELYDEFT